MAVAQTYEPIATYTASGSIANYTFSSIPSTYTDLRVVCSAYIATGPDDLRIRFNGDTGNNYSSTLLRSTGSANLSARDSNSGYIYWVSYVSTGAGDVSVSTTDIMSYANASKYKTVLSRGNLSSGFVNATAMMWKSTAAINSITISSGANITSGSTFTIYGIKAA